jgi:cytochrome c556
MSGLKRHVIGAIVVAAVVTVSVAATTGTEAIKQRQKEMEGVYGAMKTFAAIAKKEQPFDAEVVQASAAKMAGHLAQAAELFPEGSDQGDVQTWAKAEIWADGNNFDKLMESSHQAATDMQAVAEAEAFMPALGKLGNSCKSCHDLYRLPKN